MKRYDERILNALLDRYENSSLYYGRNQIVMSVSVPFKKSLIPEYFDDSSIQYDVIHDQMRELEEAGLIRIVWKNRRVGHIVEKVVLNLEHIWEAYQRIGRLPKKEKEQNIRTILSEVDGTSNRTVQAFVCWLRNRIELGESIKRYVDIDEPRQLERLLKAVMLVTENRQEMFVREFSILHFQDSKTFEAIAGKVTDVIREFSDPPRFDQLTKEQILEEYNLFHNPSCLMMKGTGALRIGESHICLNTLVGGLGIQSQDLGQLRFASDGSVKRVLTIENLTVFHRWKEPETLILYLGGYHNPAKRIFLKKVYETFPDAEYRHFGDIDCGGFHIYHDLCVKTGIPFQTYYMNRNTMERCLRYAKSLTASDLRELERMIEQEEYADQRDVMVYMMETGKKLEQECVYQTVL